MDELQKLGNRIRTARKDKGYTADYVADQCNINASYYRQLESGRKIPSLPMLIQLCNVLDATPNYLLQDELTQNQSAKDINALIASIQNASSSQLSLMRELVNTTSTWFIEHTF